MAVFTITDEELLEIIRKAGAIRNTCFGELAEDVVAPYLAEVVKAHADGRLSDYPNDLWINLATALKAIREAIELYRVRSILRKERG